MTLNLTVLNLAALTLTILTFMNLEQKKISDLLKLYLKIF